MAHFLDRAIEERDTSIRAVAGAVSGGEPESTEFKNWERKLRRWGGGKQQAIDKAGAEQVGAHLNADLSRFVAVRQSQVDLLTETLRRIDEIDLRLLALEQARPAP